MPNWPADSDAFDLERDLPVTGKDVAALKRLRDHRHHLLLKRLHLLRPPTWLPAPRLRRPTHQGFAPFELK